MACTPAQINNLDGDLDNSTAVDCDIDASLSIETAYDGVFDSDQEDSLCPTTDLDFWRYSVTAPNQIVDIDVSLTMHANIRLQTIWSGPIGVCVNDPEESCTGATDCDAADACDISRSLCRPTDVIPCALDIGCDAGTACGTTRSVFAEMTENIDDGDLHLIQTILPATEPGDYFLESKSVDLNFVPEPDNPYIVRVGSTTDPDTNEPNNHANMATDLTSGSADEGFLAYAGDDDWYRIPHTVTNGAPVIDVELSWPLGVDFTPTFELCYPDCTAPPPADPISVGVVPDRRQVRRIRVLGPVTDPASTYIMVRVHNDEAGSGVGYSRTASYTLTVTIAEDLAEGADRNDRPETATQVTLAAPSATPTTITRAESVISTDDRDWFRIDVPAGQTDTSLLHARAVAADPMDAGFLLQMLFYRQCDPAGTADYPACGTGLTVDCGSSALTLDGGVTITPWYTFPSPDSRFTIDIEDAEGAGSFQMGGQSPNHLETMVPLSEAGDGAYYLSISHISSTPMMGAPWSIPGYSPSGLDCGADSSQNGCYVIELAHYREPDATDRTNTDNYAITRPLCERPDGRPYYERGHFFRRNRTVADGGGSQWTVDPRVGTVGFAGVLETAFVEIDSCGLVALNGYDEFGQLATTSITGLTAVSGSFVDVCGNATLTLPITLTGGTGTVNYQAGAMASLDVIAATVEGETVQSGLPVVDLGLGAPGRVSVALTDGGAPPTSFVTDGGSGTLRISLPAAATTPVVLTLEASSPAAGALPSIACVNWGGDCGGLADASIVPEIPAASRCTSSLDDNVGSCQIAILTDETSYDILLSSSAAGPLTLRISDRDGVELDTYYTAAIVEGAHFEFVGFDSGTGYFATGYLSYAGDQDFFNVPVSNQSFPGYVQMTIRVQQSAGSALEVRAVATRGSAAEDGVGAGAGGGDLCGNCGSGSACDARGFCSRTAPLNALVGAEGTTTECVFVVPDGDVAIWVNDAYANDWDLTVPYEISLMMEEGCPAVCETEICAQ